MSLENALLGLLNHRPMTGYDLIKILDYPMGFFWAATSSSNVMDFKERQQKSNVCDHKTQY